MTNFLLSLPCSTSIVISVPFIRSVMYYSLKIGETFWEWVTNLRRTSSFMKKEEWSDVQKSDKIDDSVDGQYHNPVNICSFLTPFCTIQLSPAEITFPQTPFNSTFFIGSFHFYVHWIWSDSGIHYLPNNQTPGKKKIIQSLSSFFLKIKTSFWSTAFDLLTIYM